MNRKLRNLCCSIFFFPFAVVAGSEVHQCEDRGNVTYQATPCARGKAVKTWRLHEAAAPPSSSQQVLAAEGRSMARKSPPGQSRSARRVSAPGAAIGRSRGGGEGTCESTRRQRAAAYEKAGLKRNFALSSHWDNKVQQACQ